MGMLKKLAPLAVLLGLALPASASAATYQLRPDGTLTASSWSAVPGTTPLWDTLDDAVVQPAAPSTASDYATTGGSFALESSLTTVTLASGETPASLTGWAYFSTPAGRGAWMVLVNTATNTSLGMLHVAAGSPAAWHSLAMATTPTQSDIDNFAIAVTPDSGSGTTNVYAVYAALTTNDPPPPPPVDPPPSDPPPSDPPPSDPPPSNPPSDPPVDPPTGTTDPTKIVDPIVSPGDVTDTGKLVASAPVTIAVKSVTATAKGQIPIPVSCAANAVGGCEGTISLEDASAGSTGGSAKKLLVSARRVKRTYGRRHYKLAPGETRTVPIKMSRRTFRKKFRRRRSVKLTVVIEQKDGSGHKTTYRRVVHVKPPHRRK